MTTREQAKTRFYDIVTELGGRVIGEYSLNNTPVEMVCPSGHVVRASPQYLYNHGRIPCIECSFPGPQLFLGKLQSVGATLIEYNGHNYPAKIECRNGHISTPIPHNIFNGQGVCIKCRAREQADIQINRTRELFIARLREINATLMGEYRGRKYPVEVRCNTCGHISFPQPGAILNGQGVCKPCAWAGTDCLYLVYNPLTDVHKVGVTSGDYRTRIRGHRREGFTELVRIYTGVARAYDIEQRILRSILDSGYSPVRGKEYFRVDRDWIAGLVDRSAPAGVGRVG